jgi:hypothetical protein
MRAQLAVAFLLAALAAGAAEAADLDAAKCRELERLKVMNRPGESFTNLLSADLVPAEGDLPTYCRVLGYIRPAINFELRLPVEGWNGKLYVTGCGGFCGRVEADRPGFINAMNYGLRRGYAAVTTDSGHWGESATDARWAYDSRLAEIDWGYRAIHETAIVAKALVEAAYGSAPRRSYFEGCSTGGRMGVMEAIRFPEDFDGILAGAPALDYTSLVATTFAWLVQANTSEEGAQLLGPAEAALVGRAVLASCDAVDGLADGLISDPRRCRFDPSSLLCKGAQAKDCLTPEQIEALGKWYGGPRDSEGNRLFPGALPLGSEPYWWLWLTGNEKGEGKLIPSFADDFLRYMAFASDPGETYTALDFDFDLDPANLATMGEIYNATDPDLSRFKARGGKLLVWHGLADAIVTPWKTIDYVDEVAAGMGGMQATSEFLRLFLVPGMDHCGLTPGPGITQAGFDPLTALEQWVEEGKAPASLLATKTDAQGRQLWQRPICPYPAQATWKGAGDGSRPEQFACTTP